VFIVAGGTTAYRKYFPDYKLEELAMIAFKDMLEDNDLKMDPLEVKGLINFASYGEFADHFQDQQYFVSSGKRRGNGSQVTL
jgi:type II secretory pathway component PulL